MWNFHIISLMKFVVRLLALATTIGAYSIPGLADDFYVFVKDNRVGYVNRNGRILIKPKFEYGGEFKEGLARVRNDNDWGFIDGSGNLKFSLSNAVPHDFSEGLAATKFSYKTGERWGFIDTTGKVVISPKLDSAGSFSEGFATAAVKHDTGQMKYGFINKSGDFVVKPVYDDVESFSEGLAAVKEDGMWGFVDTDGSPRVHPQFKAASNFHEGIAFVNNGSKYGFIDQSGKLLSGGYSYAQVRSFSEGLAAVESGESWGYVDKTDGFAIKPVFGEAGDFSEGLAPVKTKTGVTGFVDKKGSMVLMFPFSSTTGFHGGRAFVVHSVWGTGVYINREGAIMSEFSLKDCSFCASFFSSPRHLEDLDLSSTPPGASVYLVDLWHYDDNPRLQNGERDELEKYRAPGPTDIHCKSCVAPDKYWAFLILGQIKCRIPVHIIEGGKSQSYSVVLDQSRSECK